MIKNEKDKEFEEEKRKKLDTLLEGFLKEKDSLEKERISIEEKKEDIDEKVKAKRYELNTKRKEVIELLKGAEYQNCYLDCQELYRLSLFEKKDKFKEEKLVEVLEALLYNPLLVSFLEEKTVIDVHLKPATEDAKPEEFTVPLLCAESINWFLNCFLSDLFK